MLPNPLCTLSLAVIQANVMHPGAHHPCVLRKGRGVHQGHGRVLQQVPAAASHPILRDAGPWQPSPPSQQLHGTWHLSRWQFWRSVSLHCHLASAIRQALAQGHEDNPLRAQEDAVPDSAQLNTLTPAISIFLSEASCDYFTVTNLFLPAPERIDRFTERVDISECYRH